MRRVLILLLGIFIIVTIWFLIPVFVVFLNINYNLPVIETDILKAIGILIFIVGFSLVLYSTHQQMLTGRVTPVIIESPKKFIAEGLYKYSRNPMFIGFFLAFIGIFMIFGHILLLVYALLTLPVFQLIVVYIEEPELKRKFGESYQSYIKKVPRWLPKVK